ncbi:hypothetical protein BJX99DRAFT_122609 [Aspergillus californicus]
MAMTGQTGQLTTSDPLALTGEKGGSGGETLSDMSMRRRIQNRNAQRNFRTRQREAKEFQQQQQQAAAAAAAATAAAAASTVPPISLNTTAPILQQNPTPSPSYTSEVYIPPATLGASDAAYDSLWLPQFNSAIDYFAENNRRHPRPNSATHRRRVRTRRHYPPPPPTRPAAIHHLRQPRPNATPHRRQARKQRNTLGAPSHGLIKLPRRRSDTDNRRAR